MTFLTKTCFIALCLLFFVSSFGQGRLYTGRVQASSGAGIAAATIIANHSNRTVFADSVGAFSIPLDVQDTLLTVSATGFIQQSFSLSTHTSSSFVLADDPKSMTEVVVTAYGIRKEFKRVGYAVQEVKGADLIKARDPNALNSLAGKVAGLSVGANTEMLGRPDIVLRGSKDLLFVVDGVPINSDTWNISPDDIESYSVLKGPNAAALYGSRGINGAIVITTRRGSMLRTAWQIDVNTSTLFEKGFVALPQSQVEYGRGTNFQYSYGDRLYDNKQRLPEWGPRFEGQLVKQYDSPYDRVSNVRTATPWTARGAHNFENFMQTGIINNNNVALSTAGDRYDFRLSLSNLNQRGMGPNTMLHTYTAAISGGYKISDRLRVDASFNFNKQYSPNIPDVNYGPNSYIYMFKVYGSADYNVNDLKDIYKAPQGVKDLIPYAQEYGRENSAWFIAKKWLRTHDKTDVNGYVKASYKFSNSLSATLRTQITGWNLLRTEQVPSGANLNTYLPWYYFGWYGDYREDRRSLFENNSDLIFNYDKRFHKLSVTALAGAATRSFSYNSLWGTTKALAIPNVYVLTNSQQPYSAYTWDSKMQVYSGFYSLDLTYDKYLTLSHTGRVDRLSTLADGYNTFYYPSVSVSTVLSDYLTLPSFISFAKLRGSYANVKGALTSPTIATAFTQVTGQSINGGLLGYGTDYYTSYDGPTYANQNAYSFVSYYNNQPSVSFSNTISNPALKPFTVSSYEAGADLKFLQNRLSLDFTYFTTLNGPLIVALPVAPSVSYDYHNVNGGTTKKQGIEVSLYGSPVKSARGLSWDVLLNYSTFKETLYQIYGNEKVLSQNGHNYAVGERLDAIYGAGFVHDGSGSIVYSGGLPLRAPSDVSNNTFLGHTNPDFTFGINNRFTYRNFSLSFQFDGRIGGKIYDEVYKDGMNGGTALESASGDFGVARLKEWQSTNNGTVAPTGYYVASGVKIVSGTPVYANGQITNLKDISFAPNDVATTVQKFISSGIGNVTQYWMTDRSFAKLREVILTYNLPSRLLGGSRVFKGASVSLIGRNLLYFAKRKDIDLDPFASGYNASDRSLNNGGLLQSVTGRRYGFNINFNF